MESMESEWINMLKKHSKDETSFEKLQELFNRIVSQRDRYKTDLELLEAAIRNDYDSILITELDLKEPGPRIVYVNDGFTEMTGYSREEAIGKTPRILQGPKTDPEVLKRLKRSLKEGKSFFGQTVNYRKDGSEFVNQWDIHPLTDREGNITHWVSYQHDITERKRAEKVLVDTQVEFDSLREASRQTVVDVDLDGNIAMANKAFRELIGYGKDELKKLKVWELFPKKYHDSLRSRFDQGADENIFGNQHFRGIIKHKKGVPIQIEGNTNLLHLRDRTLIRAEINNISLQKRIMEALKRRKEDYSRIVERASEYTYQLQLKNGNPVYESLSEHFAVLTGVSPAVTEKEEGYEEFIHPEDHEKVKKHYQQVLEGKSCACDYRIRYSGGGYIEIIDYSRPEWDTKRESVTGIWGAVSLKPKSESTL